MKYGCGLSNDSMDMNFRRDGKRQADYMIYVESEGDANSLFRHCRTSLVYLSKLT
jgi:hypothetical protein